MTGQRHLLAQRRIQLGFRVVLERPEVMLQAGDEPAITARNSTGIYLSYQECNLVAEQEECYASNHPLSSESLTSSIEFCRVY